MISTRVKADGHRGADAKAREQIIIWIRPRIAATDVYRLICDEVMFTRSDFLLKILSAAAHDDVRCLFTSLCGHDLVGGSEFL